MYKKIVLGLGIPNEAMVNLLNTLRNLEAK